MSISKKINRISYLTHPEVIFEIKFYMFGEPLIFRTNSKALLEHAEEIFSRFQNNTTSETNPLIITLIDSGDSNRPVRFDRREPSFKTIGNSFFITLDRDNTAVADITNGCAYGFLTSDIINQKSYVQYYFIEALSQALLGPSRNFIHIHAACVRKNDISLILQGNAGSGKSTLAYACVRNGYQLLAEDVVHIKFGKEGIKLWGAPWKFHLLPDAIQLFPELKSINPSLQMNGEWKLELDIDEYHSGAAITNAKPGPIIKIVRDEQLPPSLQKLSMDKAIDELEILWPWQVGWSAKHESAAKMLIRNGMYHLYTGNSLYEPLSLLDNLILDLTYTD